MDVIPILLSGALAALPLTVAFYMWRSGDYRDERPVFWGLIALAAFAIFAVLGKTVLLVLSSIVFSLLVLWGIVSVVLAATRATGSAE